MKSDAVAFGRMNTFINLYGFARNIWMASLLGCTMLIVSGAVLPYLNGASADYERLIALLPTLFVAVIMFYRYLKFHRLYAVEMYTTYAEGT